MTKLRVQWFDFSVEGMSLTSVYLPILRYSFLVFICEIIAPRLLELNITFAINCFPGPGPPRC